MGNQTLLTFLLLTFSLASWAQVDPGALMLNSSSDESSVTNNSSTPSGDETSGRYIRRSKHGVKRNPAAAPAVAPAPTPDTPTVVIPSPEESRLTPTPPGAARLSAEPKVTPAVASSSPVPPPPSDEQTNFSAGMRDFFLGGDVDLIENYKSFLDAQDIRKNTFELSLATGYFYNASTSSSFFRNYNDTAPTLDVGADIWLTPFLGIDAEYRLTLLNSLPDSPTQNSTVNTTQSWFDLGVKFRRFFGMALSSASLAVGLKYVSYNLNVPSSSLTRAKEQTQGPELSLDLSLPASRNYFWDFGLMIEPFLSHSETSNPNVQSGGSNQSLGVGASAGGEYRLSRQTRAFFKLSTLLYRSNFSGSAASADPVTGSVSNNVSVTNAFYMLDLGLRFGR